MAMQMASFDDLLRLLDEHPEWRAELRRRVLDDEFLELPALTRSLAAAQQRTEEQLAALTARVDALAAAQQRTEEQLAALTAAQQRTEERLAEVAAAQVDL